MAGLSVTVDDRSAQALFARLEQFGRFDARLMRKVGLAAKQEAYNAFRFEQSPDGRPWPALANATLGARRRKGNHSIQPLVATGAMYASIEAEATDTEATLTVGAGLPDKRAWYNQFGTLKAPERPFLPLTTAGANPPQAWLDAVFAPLREALDEAMAG